MADNFGSGKASNKVTTGLHDGLKSRSPKFKDSSLSMKGAGGKGYGGGSVNNDTTRSSVAPTPKSLGPRTA